MLRFVPIAGSLSDDAPGYHVGGEVAETGPICWKCDGLGTVRVKQQQDQTCKVCNGQKRLAVKAQLVKGKRKIGTITSRSAPDGWVSRAPHCAHKHTDAVSLPCALVPQEGEQLCVFVGDWRIYQRTGGHRWTTDDLVTGWVAGKAARNGSPGTPETSRGSRIQRTLDLGCGNGSVLMMVAWQYPEAQCIGVEARSEAVGLARRSILYNIGHDNAGQCRVKVINDDFRRLIHEPSSLCSVDSEGSTLDDCLEPTISSILDSHQKFDIITGTPPYFRVDFQLSQATRVISCETSSSESTTAEVDMVLAAPTVEKALIRQGGMPTCKESAPARCEFRGGIEAYCAAAACNLAPVGTFVVCENWANHDRVLVAAEAAALRIVSIQRVIGKEGKPPLFCVYSMVHQVPETSSHITAPGVQVVVTEGISCSVTGVKGRASSVLESDLVVRDSKGGWTESYAEVLRDMNYPVVSLHPDGSY